MDYNEISPHKGVLLNLDNTLAYSINPTKKLHNLSNFMHLLSKPILKPGAWRFIHQCRADNKRLGLITDMPKIFTNLYKIQTPKYDAPLKYLFGTVITSNDVKKAKPHPDSYRRAMYNLALKPEECFAFESSPEGIDAALSANIKNIAVVGNAQYFLNILTGDVKTAHHSALTLPKNFTESLLKRYWIENTVSENTPDNTETLLWEDVNDIKKYDKLTSSKKLTKCCWNACSAHFIQDFTEIKYKC
jgi:FMN phosphatase YigB (HAD superfamily)